MSSKKLSNKQISALKKRAKRYSKANNIRLSQCLDYVAKERGYVSWDNLILSNRQTNDSDAHSVLERLLPPQAIANLEIGRAPIRRTFFVLESLDKSTIKKELIAKVKDVVKSSDNHVFIEIRVNVPESLANSVG